MFIAAFYILAPNWTQPWCPSIGELMYKLWYMHRMEYYSIIKINKLSSQKDM